MLRGLHEAIYPSSEEKSSEEKQRRANFWKWALFWIVFAYAICFLVDSARFFMASQPPTQDRLRPQRSFVLMTETAGEVPVVAVRREYDRVTYHNVVDRGFPYLFQPIHAVATEHFRHHSTDSGVRVMPTRGMVCVPTKERYRVRTDTCRAEG